MKKSFLFVLLILLTACDSNVYWNKFSGNKKQLNISFCKEFQGEEGCLQSQNSFKTTDKQINASFPYKGKAEDFFTIDWWYLDKNQRLTKPASRQAKKDDVVMKFQLQATQDEWKPGKYSLRIYRNLSIDPLVEEIFEINK